MRVLYAINSGVLGGAEKHIADLAYGLTARGYQVYVWCKTGPINELFIKSPAIVSHHTIHFDLCLSYIFKLYKYLKREHIDVVHTHDLKAGVNALIAARLAGVPVRVGHIHTPLSVWEIISLKKTLNVYVYKLIHKMCATHEIAITDTAKTIKLKEGLSSTKIVVIPNAVSIDTEYDPKLVANYLDHWKFSDKFVVGYIGRLSIEKNLSMLVRVFARLSSDFDHIRLALIGGGDEETKLKQLISDLHIEQKVVINGIFPNEHKAAVYKTLNVFVFPSLTEGFGYVPLEALSMGLPVIASDIPVLQEVLGDSVVYFKTHDESDLYMKLKTAIIEPRQVTSHTVDKTLSKYSFQKFIDSYEALYKGKVA